MAPKNILFISVQVEVVHPDIEELPPLLNEDALLNIPTISVTLDTFQLPKSWLNKDAPWNILLISVTLDTSQEPIFILNNVAVWNIPLILVQAEVVHPDIEELPPLLNDDACVNILPISVTLDTSQEPISRLNKYAPPNI